MTEGRAQVEAAVKRLLQDANQRSAELQRLRSENESLRKSLTAVREVDNAEIDRLWATIEELEVNLALTKQQQRLPLQPQQPQKESLLKQVQSVPQQHPGLCPPAGAGQGLSKEVQALVGTGIQRHVRELLLPQIAAEIAACRAARAAPPAPMQPLPHTMELPPAKAPALPAPSQPSQGPAQQPHLQRQEEASTQQVAAGGAPDASLQKPLPQRQQQHQQPKPPEQAQQQQQQEGDQRGGRDALAPASTAKPLQSRPNEPAAGTAPSSMTGAGPRPARHVAVQQAQQGIVGAKQAPPAVQATSKATAASLPKPATPAQAQGRASPARAAVAARPLLSTAGAAARSLARLVQATASVAGTATRSPSAGPAVAAAPGGGVKVAGSPGLAQRGIKRPALLGDANPSKAQASAAMAATSITAGAVAEAPAAASRAASPSSAATTAAAAVTPRRMVVRAPPTIPRPPTSASPSPDKVRQHAPALPAPAASPTTATAAALADGPEWRERVAKRAKRFGSTESTSAAAAQPALSAPAGAAFVSLKRSHSQQSLSQPAASGGKEGTTPPPTAVDKAFMAQQKNLKGRLGGVIFICNNLTLGECQTGLLFGLPRQHWCYVRHIRKGMPLFLFNISDRHLHGIYQAASDGGWEINPAGWAPPGGRTAYPAQVRAELLKECPPLGERSFRPVLEPNYLPGSKNFLLELSGRQAQELSQLFMGRGAGRRG